MELCDLIVVDRRLRKKALLVKRRIHSAEARVLVWLLYFGRRWIKIVVCVTVQRSHLSQMQLASLVVCSCVLFVLALKGGRIRVPGLVLYCLYRRLIAELIRAIAHFFEKLAGLGITQSLTVGNLRIRAY